MEKVKLPTVNLQGKLYVQVKDRIQYFRENYANYAIRTEPKSTEGSVMFRAEIIDDKDRVLATGHSYGKLTKEKAFEKLESVAIGRALAVFGIGINESVASADEITDFLASSLQS
jgi:hypothetical protein